MKRTRERGITLVALVITIVILIILATIAINYAFGSNGLITRAEEAGSYYANDSAYTEASLANIESYIDGIIGNKWYYDEEGNVTDGTVTLEIGDYVNYNCTTGATGGGSYTSLKASNGYGEQTFTASSYTYGWRVLGVDEDTGEILLISEEIVGPTSGGYSYSNRTYYHLSGQAGYENGISELNAISAIYGQGEGATGARSITVDDINKITGYNPNNVGVNDPEQTETGTKYGEGELYEYGNRVTYYWDGTEYPYYSAANGLEENLKTSHNNTSYKNSFYWYDSVSGWKSSTYLSNATSTSMEEITTLESTYYRYYPNTLTENESGTTEGIETTSATYKMLFTNSSTGAYPEGEGLTSNFSYYLGSSYVNTGVEFTDFGLRRVYNGYVGGHNLVGSYGIEFTRNYGVRPVVSLKSDISLTDSEEKYDGCTLWNIA